ncbi:MbnP family protein [Sphingobacterium tabacisoli]|uniref:MbnP family protein n=1 Tax=Sphingobacterium tabacisoli TaxID=2044855 RepID=A0ABW5L2L0_9SPHI|nr:MbnP family protein [Sphingobacterium tabacisoli]
MKNLTNILFASALSVALISCDKSDPSANNVTLHFNNTFKDKTIVLGDANSTQASINTSAAGQTHQFSELKYVISNIRLVKTDGQEIPYNINDLDKGATVIDHSKASTLSYVLSNIPAADYKQLKFGLGVKPELNTLDEVRFPNFYNTAGKNDTKMMWEWGTGYRFTKIEGFYDTDKKKLSIHTGSTLDGKRENQATYVPGVDAYRDITLTLPEVVLVGKASTVIYVKADFDKLLSGTTNTITLRSGTGPDDNATPNIHTADGMVQFVDNLGGNGKSNQSGMFSITHVKN